MEALALELVTDLSADELRELTAAAAWYAKRHEHIVSELADDYPPPRLRNESVT